MQLGLAISGKLIHSVTILALTGGRLVKDHWFASHFARQFVAGQAGHVAVSTIERIRRPLIVVELSRFPARGVMAARTVGGFRPGGKLISMHVLMAPRAKLRSSCEIYVLQGHSHSGRTMTVNACDAAVRACERKFRRRMVEARHFVPLHR